MLAILTWRPPILKRTGLAAVLVTSGILGNLSYAQQMTIEPSGNNKLSLVLWGKEKEVVPPNPEPMYRQYQVTLEGSITIDATNGVTGLGGEVVSIEASDGRYMIVEKTGLKDGTIIATTTEGAVYTIYDVGSDLSGYIRLNQTAASSKVLPKAAVTARTAAARSSGATTSGVQEAQRLLQALGYDIGPADGVMGARTVAALKSFQSSRGLPVTGTADQKTLAALNSKSPKQ
jgi:putative peptidoglycan binding protein